MYNSLFDLSSHFINSNTIGRYKKKNNILYVAFPGFGLVHRLL